MAGSRGEVDVVASFRFRLHTSNTYPTFGRILEGSILLAPDGDLSFNFSDLHIANGKWKRERTGHQFKRVIRIVKRLQMDMVDKGVISKRIPSSVIECLVYLGEDLVFLNAADRYSRVRAVLNRILELLVGQGARGSYSFREINGVKIHFGPWQKCIAVTARVGKPDARHRHQSPSGFGIALTVDEMTRIGPTPTFGRN